MPNLVTYFLKCVLYVHENPDISARDLIATGYSKQINSFNTFLKINLAAGEN